MKTTTFAIVTLLILSFSTNAQSLKPKSIYAKKSTFEIGGEIFFTSTNYTREESGYGSSGNNSQTDFTLSGNAGVFVIDGLKLAVEPALQISSFGDDSWTRLKLYFTPEYVFDVGSNVYPFFGGSIGYTSSSYSTNYPTQSGFSWGAKGGVKINALGNALVNIGFSYYQETYDYTSTYGTDVKQHYNILGIKAGLALFFR